MVKETYIKARSSLANLNQPGFREFMSQEGGQEIIRVFI